MENLIKLLKQLNLSEKEAATYLTLFQIGTNPASTIAKAKRINRSNCYEILDKLFRKGFIKKNMVNHMTYFQAIDPQQLLYRFRDKQTRLEQSIQNFTQSLELFEKIKNPIENSPKITYLEGEKAMHTILEDTLKGNDIIRVYACLDELNKTIPNYLKEYFKRRTEKNIFVKALFPKNAASIERQKFDTLENRESKLLPAEFNFHLDINIYRDKIALFSLKDKFGLIIESNPMAQAWKNIFDQIYTQIKSPHRR